jgi:hypothetical protein
MSRDMFLDTIMKLKLIASSIHMAELSMTTKNLISV